MSQLFKCFRLYLSYSLTGDVELHTDFLEGEFLVIVQAEAAFDYGTLAGTECLTGAEKRGASVRLKEDVVRPHFFRCRNHGEPRKGVFFISERFIEGGDVLADLLKKYDTTFFDTELQRELGQVGDPPLRFDGCSHAFQPLHLVMHMNREPDHPALIGDRTRNRLVNPVCSVS